MFTKGRYSCCNPYHKGHKTAKRQVGVQPVSELDRAAGRRVLPRFNWDTADYLCLTCRRRIHSDDENLSQIRKATHLVHEAQAKKGKYSSKTQTSSVSPVQPSTSQLSFVGSLAVPSTSAGSSTSTRPSVGQFSTDASDHGSLCLPGISSAVRSAVQDDEMRLQEPEVGPRGLPIISTPQARVSFASPSEVSSTTASTSESVANLAATDDVNRALTAVGVSPARLSDRFNFSLLKRKYNRGKSKLAGKLQSLTGGKLNPSPKTDRKKKCLYCDLLFHELKDKFKNQISKPEKYKVLTCVPKRFSINQVHQHFGCTQFEAKNASILKYRSGAFSFPPPRIGRPLPRSTYDLVIQFYLLDENSRQSPFTRDVIFVENEQGERVQVAKRRMLHNLSDTYYSFQSRYKEDDVEISIAKFSTLRPKQCIWPGRFGQHVVCVCEICQNFEFLLDGIGVDLSVKAFVVNCVCGEDECYLGLCNNCPDFNQIDGLFRNIEEDEMLEYMQWERTDFTDIKKHTATVSEYKQILKDYLSRILEHQFVNQRQSGLIENLRNQTLKQEAAVTIQVDFAQNYTFIVQNSVQGFHWTNRQATIHPFVVHWWDQDNDVLAYRTYCVISDELRHDANTFHAFRDVVIKKIKADMNELQLQKVYYISDGAGSQYKNHKNFCNLLSHNEDYGLDAEWVFTATAHGKSTCDAISAVVKCKTRRESLKDTKKITNAEQMYKTCKEQLGSSRLNFIYVTKENVKDMDVSLERRYTQFHKITGVRKHHIFQRVGQNVLRMTRAAGTNTFTDINFRRAEETDFTDENLTIGSFYAFKEGASYQIGLLVEVDLEEGDGLFQTMKFNRRSGDCSWPENPVFLNVPYRDIMLMINDPNVSIQQDKEIYTVNTDQMRDIRKAYQSAKAKSTKHVAREANPQNLGVD